MLASIRGRVSAITGNRLLIEVGGLGLAVQVTPSAVSAARVGSEVELPTALVVREDSWQLFGFGSLAEREWFDLLQTVSGVGPKLALTILSAVEVDELSAAISCGDDARLTRIPGVGKKSAARLIVEIGDRLPTVAAVPSWQREVAAALLSLGWSEKDVDWAVREAASELGERGESAAGLRSALMRLGQERR